MVMEASGSSEMSVHFYQTTRPHFEDTGIQLGQYHVETVNLHHWMRWIQTFEWDIVSGGKQPMYVH